MPASVSRAVIEVILDRVSQGAATLSPEGGLSYANQRLATMLGCTRAQLLGKPLQALVALGEREKLAQALTTSCDTAAQCRVAMPRANGGGEVQALLTLAPLGHGQVSCVITDLSQPKNGGTLAHEMRNMLETLRDSVELLRRSGLDADAQRALAAIEQQGARILELLNPAE
jgi:nitrogen-specific signal transduction histidine kinase